ncbi:MAG TPA: hypothetical protein VJ904_01530 [Tichowtungia sp.]|nr:hypothetical protein [Tichowtungia sp.]
MGGEQAGVRRREIFLLSIHFEHADAVSFASDCFDKPGFHANNGRADGNPGSTMLCFGVKPCIRKKNQHADENEP